MATPIRNSIPTSVYRYFDSSGVLIYVGITGTATARNRQHNDDKEWWPWVAKQEIEHFPSRSEALGREKTLISQFRPPFNKVHNQHSAAIRTAYVAARQAGAFDTCGAGIVPMNQRRFSAPVSEADWDRGKVSVVVTGNDSPAIHRLQHQPGVAVFEQCAGVRGRKIGEVEGSVVIGGIARIVMGVKRNVTFHEVELWLKPTAANPPMYLLKQVAALNCLRRG